MPSGWRIASWLANGRARARTSGVPAHFTIALHFPDMYTLRARPDPSGATPLSTDGFGRTRTPRRRVSSTRSVSLITRCCRFPALRCRLCNPSRGLPVPGGVARVRPPPGGAPAFPGSGPPTDAGRRALRALKTLDTADPRRVGRPSERSRPRPAAPRRVAGTASPHDSTEGAIAAAPLVRPSRRAPRGGERRDDHPFREGVRLRS